MSSADTWYVRLPDGQQFRAPNRSAVLHHLETGRIPRSSQIRRSGSDQWFTAAEHPDLQNDREDLVHLKGSSPDLGPPSSGTGVAARLEATPIETVGIKAVSLELLTALDSTLVRSKVLVGLFAGAVLFLSTFVTHRATTWLVGQLDLSKAHWLVADLVFALEAVFLVGTQLAVMAVANSILTRTMFLEIAQLRRVRDDEVRFGLTGLMIKVFIAYALVPGLALCLIGFLGWLPRVLGRLAVEAGTPVWAAELIVAGTIIGGLAIDVLLWLMIGLAWLLTPILAVEECGLFEALKQWAMLLRKHLGRALLYEALALTLGTIATLPFILPVVLSSTGQLGATMIHLHPSHSGLGAFLVNGTISVFYGIAAGPLLAFLAVANVFIYLNLRYESGSNGRP